MGTGRSAGGAHGSVIGGSRPAKGEEQAEGSECSMQALSVSTCVAASSLSSRDHLELIHEMWGESLKHLDEGAG